MKQSIERFLQFNGKTLLFLAKDGTNWIALKPICEALGIEYTRTFKNVSADPIIGPALAKQPMQVPGDQIRNMICIPENWIYGWIFSINSSSPELLNYKRECYRLLYDYFHGTITRRKELLGEKVSVQLERGKLEKVLRQNPEFLQFENLKAMEARIGKSLKEVEKDEIDEQLRLQI
ncbi:hypothetical protein D4S03_02160 [bacterium]|nr:MAG: hypothetical protein D4S03_02160 [bacterium]